MSTFAYAVLLSRTAPHLRLERSSGDSYCTAQASCSPVYCIDNATIACMCLADNANAFVYQSKPLRAWRMYGRPYVKARRPHHDVPNSWENLQVYPLFSNMQACRNGVSDRVFHTFLVSQRYDLDHCSFRLITILNTDTFRLP